MNMLKIATFTVLAKFFGALFQGARLLVRNAKSVFFTEEYAFWPKVCGACAPPLAPLYLWAVRHRFDSYNAMNHMYILAILV